MRPGADHAAASTRVIEAEGYRFFYRRYDTPGSSRPAVLILNGFLQTMDSWVKYVHHFSREAPVIIADLPGAGDADPVPAGAFDLQMLARCTIAILDREGVPATDIISASYGAAIGYTVAREYPHRVSHLLLAGVTRALTPEARETIRAGMACLQAGEMHAFAEAVTGLLMNDSARQRIPRHDLVRRLLYNQLVRLPAATHAQYLINAQHLLDHPPIPLGLDPHVAVLVVTGEDDKFTPPAEGQAVASHLPNAVFRSIRNADHLFHLEQTDVTIRLIGAFFRGESLAQVEGTMGIAADCTSVRIPA